ncbi:preprotein translocase subunit YajC [Mycobacteroides abscessus subsp. abscessus]|nr:preprotein translocase subunit YajC [Mycobacteroides abscessus subsp. abscessus]
MDLLIPLALAALLIFFLFNSRRKQKARAEQIKAGLVPGAKVMTTFGVFGTVLSINDEDNQVTIESGPGTILKVHRQAIGQIENPETDVAPIADGTTDDAAETPAITDAELDAMADANTAEARRAEEARKTDTADTIDSDTTGGTTDKKAVDGLEDDSAAGDSSKKPGSTPDSDDKKN